MEKITLTARTASVMSFLQANHGQYFGDEIAAAVGFNPRGIQGVLNSLVKLELIEKEQTFRAILNEDGTEMKKSATVYRLTIKGQNFDVDAATIDAE